MVFLWLNTYYRFSMGGSLKAAGFGDGIESNYVFLFSVSEQIDELSGL
jgi:hypothetical protein